MATEFEIFNDASFESDKSLKSDEIRIRESKSLVILPRQPLPHEIARGAERLWPHQLLVPLEPWQDSVKPIRPLPAVRKRMGGFT